MTRTILLADDSVTIQKVVELTFMDEDFRVVAVGSGTDALEQIDAVRPDLVISDVHMPGADGYEVCQRARATLPSTPVLLLVGTFEVFDQERAQRVGASGHLKKPFDSQELLRRVKELLAAPPPAWVSVEAPSEELLVPIEEPDWQPEPVAPEVSDWNLEAAPAEASWAAEPDLPAEPIAPPPPPQAPAERFELPVVETEVAGTPPSAAAVAGNGGGPLSEAEIDRIARRVVELLGDGVVREVAWEVVPDLAEVLLKARIRELEASVE